MTYDPRIDGAKCDVCPMRLWREGEPVPAELNPHTKVLLIGEAPGKDEVDQERPFVGVSGKYITRLLSGVGMPRGHLSWTNTICCRPPDNKMEAILSRVQAHNRKIRKQNTSIKALNKEREKQGQAPIPFETEMPLPADCCAPRLAKEMERFSQFLLVDGMAVKRTLGGNAKITDMRGSLIDAWHAPGTPDIHTIELKPGEADPGPLLERADGNPWRRVKALPLLHPAFVLRAKRWANVLERDVNRAARWFSGALEWVDPKITYQPSPQELRDFLSRSDIQGWGFDTETDGIDPMLARIRCIAIGDGQNVMVVGFLSKNGSTRFYPEAVESELVSIICEFLADPTKVKIGHNAGNYDRIVCYQNWGVIVHPIFDTIIAHKLVASEHPHNLGFVASVYTDARAWKADREGKKKALHAETDAELWRYCAMDVAIDVRLVPPLLNGLNSRNQQGLLKFEHAVQERCSEMTRLGMRVNEKNRLAHEVRLKTQAVRNRKLLRDIIGNPDFNPSSPVQVREILFDRWNLMPDFSAFGNEDLDRRDFFNEAGDPSTNDTVLGNLSMNAEGLTEQQKNFLHALRQFRKATKLLGTYIFKLRPRTLEIAPEEAAFAFDADESPDEKAERLEMEAMGYQRTGIVDPYTHRFYPGYNCLTTSGRLASSRPINAQNFPSDIRDIVCAAPGHVLVGIDADQLELRIAAARWGLTAYLAALAAGADPHCTTSLMIFGPGFKLLDGFIPGVWDGDLFIPAPSDAKWGGEAKKRRDLAKRVQYASQYGALTPTVYRVIRETEDKKTGKFVYAHLKIGGEGGIREMHNKWLDSASDGNPGIRKSWERLLHIYRRQGFMIEPVSGRRRDFLDGENPQEIYNYDVQPTAASLMIKALLDTVDECPLNSLGPDTGVITQCHDSITAEVPADRALWMANLLERAMTITHEAVPGVTITGKPTFSKKNGVMLIGENSVWADA